MINKMGCGALMRWKIKSWIFSFIAALLFSRSFVIVFPFVIPECRAGGCELHELLGYFLWDFYNPLIVFVVTTYIFILNFIFIKRYDFIFSSVIGIGAGFCTIILYPSDWTEILNEFFNLMGIPHSGFGFFISLSSYLALFAMIFFITSGIYFLSIRGFASKRGSLDVEKQNPG